MRCQQCSGLLQHMGNMDNLAWFQCQACGWEVSDFVEYPDSPACEISDSKCWGDTHQPVGHDLWFCEAHAVL